MGELRWLLVPVILYLAKITICGSQTVKIRKSLLKDPNFLRTFEHFSIRKGVHPYIEEDICRHACNKKSDQCTIKFVKRRSRREQEDRDKLDAYLTRHLLPLPYIKSNLTGAFSGRWDLDVDCIGCQGNTEGSMCQYCKKGFYDTNRMERIQKVQRVHNNDILRVGVDCQPCDCHREGSRSYICNQKPNYSFDWGSGLTPIDLLDKPREYVEKFVTYGNEVGDCRCKPGYTGKQDSTKPKRVQCDTCNHTAGLTEPSGQMKNWWVSVQEKYHQAEMEGTGWIPMPNDHERICVNRSCDLLAVEESYMLDSLKSLVDSDSEEGLTEGEQGEGQAGSRRRRFNKAFNFADKEDERHNIHMVCRHKDTQAYCKNGNCHCTDWYYGKTCQWKRRSRNGTQTPQIFNTLLLFLLIFHY